MSLRDKLAGVRQLAKTKDRVLDAFGVMGNPFPTSNQTSGNPHYPLPEDDQAEDRIGAFVRDGSSEVLVVVGTQGVGKTNFINHLEQEIRGNELGGYYVVKYMADPEPSFNGTIRAVLQELGTGHLKSVVSALAASGEGAADVLAGVRSYDLRQALLALRKNGNDDGYELCMEWLFGFRVFKAHREALGVNFRLDTVESRTAILRDYILLGAKLKTLSGIFLLLDELEKQAGVLGPRAVVRYLSALRAIIDALPRHLFMIVAITPDAMRRYASALPAFRSRLDNQIALKPLGDVDEARRLAEFYLEYARERALEYARREGEEVREEREGDIVTREEVAAAFAEAAEASRRRRDEGVRQREFLNRLHNVAEARIRGVAS